MCVIYDTDDAVGTTKEGENVSGTITIPEVAHDTEEDEYVVCSLFDPTDVPCEKEPD